MSFKSKSFAEAKAGHRPMKRSAMSRGSKPMGRGKGFIAKRPESQPQGDSGAKKTKRKGIGRGSKTAAWDTERIRLKVRFVNAGILTCELRYAGCWFDNALGFAHAKKRRNLSKAEMSIVILACNPCHDKIETSPDMERIVMAVISARSKQP